MPRSQPTSSWAAACRHFFRHIDDPRELRRNPIAARFFIERDRDAYRSDRQVTASIRSAIMEMLHAYEMTCIASGKPEASRRRRLIVVLQILGGHSVAEVAEEIHVSRAQFYKERQAICEYLARGLTASAAAPSETAASALELDALAIARAKLLFEACEFSRAFDTLESVARESSHRDRQIEALYLAAQMRIAQTQYAGAEAYLESIARLLSAGASEMSLASQELGRLRAQFTDALLASKLGAAERADRAIADMLHRLHGATGLSEDFRKLYVEALLFAAERDKEHGSNERYRKYLATAREVFLAITKPEPIARVKLLMASSLLCDARGSDAPFSECARMLMDARDLACNAGLTLTGLEVALTLAQNYAFGFGNFPMALEEAEPVLSYALASRNPALIGTVCQQIGEIHVTFGDFVRGLELLGIAQQQGSCDAYANAAINCEAAMAYVGLQDHQKALVAARSAYNLACSMKNKRLQSAALRLSALAYYGGEELQLAKEYISGALALLDRSGPKTATAFTYSASAVITGNKTHARIARSLNAKVHGLPGQP